MEIRLLEDGYRNNTKMYEDFIHNRINTEADYFSKEVILIDKVPSFPIYMGKGSDGLKREYFQKAIFTLYNYYIETPRDIHLNGKFWHSLFVGCKRNYVLDLYPKVLEGKNEFENIVLKPFDWENYIYKSVLAAEYIKNANITKSVEIEHYINLIYDNLDLYNYILKYRLFRNSDFVIKLLTIIDEENISREMKAKIKHPSIKEQDLRYGRQVILELNKSYPVIMAPSLSKNDLKKLVVENLELLLSKYPHQN